MAKKEISKEDRNLVGTTIDGKYRITKIVGVGGMSVVYLAINDKANKHWAIKKIRKNGNENDEIKKESLIMERNLLKKIDHPNLPSIIDVIEDENTIMLVMDFVNGVSLSKKIRNDGPQNQEDVVKWTKQLCDVLTYFHEQSPPIIYRDMKPGNIILKPNGDITLIDFGTVREYKSENEDQGDTKNFGTVGYAAPEQLQNTRQSDARTDIYSLGVTVYHLLTGHNPATPPYEILPITEVNPKLSKGLEKIILKCTKNNPDERYQTCKELLNDLELYKNEDKKIKNKMMIKLITCSSFFVLSLFSTIASLLMPEMKIFIIIITLILFALGIYVSVEWNLIKLIEDVTETKIFQNIRNLKKKSAALFRKDPGKKNQNNNMQKEDFEIDENETEELETPNRLFITKTIKFIHTDLKINKKNK